MKEPYVLEDNYGRVKLAVLQTVSQSTSAETEQRKVDLQYALDLGFSLISL